MEYSTSLDPFQTPNVSAYLSELNPNYSFTTSKSQSQYDDPFLSSKAQGSNISSLFPSRKAPKKKLSPPMSDKPIDTEVQKYRKSGVEGDEELPRVTTNPNTERDKKLYFYPDGENEAISNGISLSKNQNLGRRKRRIFEPMSPNEDKDNTFDSQVKVKKLKYNPTLEARPTPYEFTKQNIASFISPKTKIGQKSENVSNGKTPQMYSKISKVHSGLDTSKHETTKRLLDENLVSNFMELSGVEEVTSFDQNTSHSRRFRN